MDRRASLALWFVAVFFLGLVTRIYLEKYTYIFGFDSYWFARMVSYIIKNGHLPDYDPLTFRGFEPVKIHWELSMEFPAWVYRIVYGSAYDKMRLLTVFKWLPAVFGALGSVIAGLIGLVLAGPLAGILTGIFAATNPGYIYRTMSGFYEDDATSFLLFLGFLFAFLAYRSKDRRWSIGYALLAGISWLLSAISWTGFFIVPYTFVVFVALWVGYHIFRVAAHYFDYSTLRRYEYYLAPILGGVLAILGWLFVRYLAYKEAGDAIYLTGALSPTTIYTLALSPLSVFFWGAFAAAAVLALHKRDVIHGYVSLGTLAIALLTVMSAANHTLTLTITPPDGITRNYTVNLGSYGAALFGSALLILVAQVAGAFAAILFFKGGEDEKFNIDWKVAGIFTFALLLAAFSCIVNNFCWYSNALRVITHIIFPPEHVSGTSGALVAPYRGFIEPLTGGPWTNVIGEETTGFLNWPAKYGILAALVLFTIPFIFYRALRDRSYLIVLAWVMLTWWAAWYKLKFAYYFGVPIAIAVALALTDVYSALKRWGRVVTAVTIAVVAVISASMAATGVFHTVSKVPTLITDAEANEMYMFGGQSAEDYLELFQWIDANTPADANLLNWWSIGHWLTFFTNRGVMTDNTNARIEADYEAAQFYLFDENTAYAIAKKRHMNYVIVESSLFWGASSLAIYAYKTTDLRDPRLADYVPQVFTCSQGRTGAFANKYICFDRGGNLVATVDVNRFVRIPPFGPGFYQETNSAVRLVYGNRDYVLYLAGVRNSNGRAVATLIGISPKMNDSTLVKMLLHAPLDHFKFVWSSKNQRVLVYEVE